jgi:ADP-ribosylation factor related protein 1
VVTNDQVEGVPVVILANKQDLRQALRVEEIKEVFNKIAVQIGAQSSQVLPVSALSGYIEVLITVQLIVWW